MRNELSGVLAVNASVLIDLILLSERGKVFLEALLNETVVPYTTEYAIMETKYIICRKFGWEKATEKVNKILNSGYFNVVKTEEIGDIASKYKCMHSVSLPDALVLSLAEYLGCSALFSRREKEIITEIKKNRLNVKVLFLEDYVKEK